ncbi:MAG: diguanylate cyclase [Eubacteriales bacterium]|nr:diguanylate cyclase [Eubacteriales bacterium]
MKEGLKQILVVDDSKINLTMVRQALPQYQVTPVLSGRQALKFLERKTPDLILLDVNMPEMDGKETLKEIRRQEHLKKIPIIFLTADNSTETEVECLELGADDYIARPFIPEVMRQRISRILELWELRHDLEYQLIQRTSQMEKVTFQSITAIAYAIDAKDPYTHGHSVRVAQCAVEIAKRLNWSKEDRQNLFFSALLHDIGKIGVPDSILNKASALTKEEMDVMKRHPLIGGDILKDIKAIRHVEDGARYHHERYDGAGYPYGVEGERIPLIARIIGVADAYDAMTSNRAYRKHLPREKVIEELEHGRGTQFDPILTDLFLEMLHDGFYLTAEEGEASSSAEEEEGLIIRNITAKDKPDVSHHLSMDALTGLHSRRYATEMMDQYLESHSNHGTLFVVGVDNLKYLNKHFGYLHGDILLRGTASLLQQEIKEDGFAARVSGDEFLLFFEKAFDKEEIVGRAQAILKDCRNLARNASYGKYMSFSIGISVAPEDGRTFEELYENADKALYFAKRSGSWTFHQFSQEEEVGQTEASHADETILRQIMRGRKPVLSVGTVHGDAEKFDALCALLHRSVERNRRPVQLVLLTLSDVSGASGKSDPQIIEEAMEMLESAIQASVRKGDISSRYSSCQVFVVLVDSDLENGRLAMERIVGQFKKIYPTQRIQIAYNIQEILPEKE